MKWGSLIGGVLGGLAGSIIPGVGTAWGAAAGSGAGAAADGGGAEAILMAAAMGGLGGNLAGGMQIGEAAAQGATQGIGAAGMEAASQLPTTAMNSMPLTGAALPPANLNSPLMSQGLGAMAQPMAGGNIPALTEGIGGMQGPASGIAQAPGFFSKMASNPMMMMAGAQGLGALVGGGGGGAPQEDFSKPLDPVAQRRRMNAPGANGYSGGFGGGQRYFAQGGLAQLHSPDHPMGAIMMLRQNYGSRQEALSDLMRGEGPAAELLTGPDDPKLMYAFGEGSGRYVQGAGDGMSDDVPTTIEGEQPAALADGEYVIPADAVSHIGNGSSNAGAGKLDDLVKQLRKARTGRSNQAPAIDAERYLSEV